MRREWTDRRIAIGALIAFAFWIFVFLPFYYGPRNEPQPTSAPQRKAKITVFGKRQDAIPSHISRFGSSDLLAY
jgi:hypothetical protein